VAQRTTEEGLVCCSEDTSGCRCKDCRAAKKAEKEGGGWGDGGGGKGKGKGGKYAYLRPCACPVQSPHFHLGPWLLALGFLLSDVVANCGRHRGKGKGGKGGKGDGGKGGGGGGTCYAFQKVRSSPTLAVPHVFTLTAPHVVVLQGDCWRGADCRFSHS
jgi:hypothetical protein